jgi:hypothetical protein
MMNHMQYSTEVSNFKSNFKNNFTHPFSSNDEDVDPSRKKRKPRKLTSFSSDSDSTDSYYSDSDNSTSSSDNSETSKKVIGYTFPELDQYNSFINFLTRKRLASNSTGFSSHIAAFVYKLASKRQCLLPRKGKHRYRRKL